MLVKKIFSIFALLLFANPVLAANPDAFVISVNPNPLQPNQAADMTIKAVQADGTIVPDYVGTVVMDLE